MRKFIEINIQINRQIINRYIRRDRQILDNYIERQIDTRYLYREIDRYYIAIQKDICGQVYVQFEIQYVYIFGYEECLFSCDINQMSENV